jgi:hypothetical protein
MFDAKIYKNVDGIFNVSSCGEWNKKNFENSDFYFQLPSLLVETMLSRSRCLDGNLRKNKVAAVHLSEHGARSTRSKLRITAII